MKTTSCLLLVTALLAGGCQSTKTASAPKTSGNVTVNFQDSEKFTDARETFGGSTSQLYLDQLSEHLQRVAARHLAAGQKLEVTFTDIDLAGEFLPTRASMDQVRIVKDIYMPRLTLTFKLTGADGAVVKEGERKLTDLNFMNNARLTDRNQPLPYEKPLLTDWVEREFKS